MQEEKLVQAIVNGRFTITKVKMTVGEILKENEQKKEKVMGGGLMGDRESGSKRAGTDKERLLC